MRIATSQIFDRPTSLMSALSERADTLQTQIATGVKFTRASDDAAAYQRLQGIKREDASDGAWSANVKLAQGLLAQGDSTLDSIQTQLQRALELATQAGDGTLSDANRAQIATSLDSVVDDLLALANTKDVRGQPLFGGTSGDAAYVRGDDGSIVYAGTGAPAAIPISDGNAMQATVAGDQVFGASGSDMFAVLATLSAALAGGEDANAASVEALDGIKSTLDQVSAARASIGARAIRLDLETERLSNAEVAREETRQGIEQTDISSTIAELQKTLTVLQATQASFTKLSSMTLFDYLR